MVSLFAGHRFCFPISTTRCHGIPPPASRSRPRHSNPQRGLGGGETARPGARGLLPTPELLLTPRPAPSSVEMIRRRTPRSQRGTPPAATSPQKGPWSSGRPSPPSSEPSGHYLAFCAHTGPTNRSPCRSPLCPLPLPSRGLWGVACLPTAPFFSGHRIPGITLTTSNISKPLLHSTST